MGHGVLALTDIFTKLALFGRVAGCPCDVRTFVTLLIETKSLKR